MGDVDTIAGTSCMRVGDTILGDTILGTKRSCSTRISRATPGAEPSTFDLIQYQSNLRSRESAAVAAETEGIRDLDHLPEDILVEILGRLPCKKFVFRCKCVSKLWCTLLSNPYFIRRFLLLQVDKQETPMIVLTQISTRGLELRGGMWSPSNPLPSLFKKLMSCRGLKEEPIVVATYGDLVLCCSTTHNQCDHFICSPCTLQWLALPPTPSCRSQFEDVTVGFFCDPYLKGKETVQININYRFKVVRIPETKDGKYTIEIFSSETGGWREVIVSIPLEFCPRGSRYTFWFQNDKTDRSYFQGDQLEDLVALGSFRTKDKTKTSNTTRDCRAFEFIHPDDVDRHQGVEIVGVRRGCLLLCEIDLNNSDVLLWEMMEEQDEMVVVNGGGNFCTKHNCSVYPSENQEKVVAPLGLDPANEDILYLIGEDVFNIVMLNIDTRSWSKISALGWEFFTFAYLWWPTPVPKLLQRPAIS